jgi:hypothetical protein
MKYKYVLFSFGFVLYTGLLSSCKKYLDASPSASLTVPTTVSDFQSILDFSPNMNSICASAGETASDNYYLNDSLYNALFQSQDRLAYLWQPGQFTGISPNDWQNEYTVVYNANLVLEGLVNVARTTQNAPDYDLCKGMALAFRGKSFYEVAQIFAKGYDSASADKDLGIPLRLTADFNVASVRSTLKDTYSQIISDLTTAISLLPSVPPSFPYRPYKGSAFGLLARVYLAMGEYPQALAAADSALSYKNTLLDYNTVPAGSQFAFSSMQYSNPEDMLHFVATFANFDLLFVFAVVDTSLYASYAANDLRKLLYFQPNANGTYYYAGSYDGGALFYCGIATDELYLIKAECEARAGDVLHSLADLNALLVKRWVSGTYAPYTAPDANTALGLVLTERRKELLFRMQRFTDIKRLNIEGYNITVTRVIGGQTYTLPPNDSRDAIQIPANVIQLTGMQQN